MRGRFLTGRVRVRLPPGRPSFAIRGEPGAHPRLLTVLRGFESLPLSQFRPCADADRKVMLCGTEGHHHTVGKSARRLVARTPAR